MMNEIQRKTKHAQVVMALKIANALMAANMLDVPVVVAVPIIASECAVASCFDDAANAHAAAVEAAERTKNESV